MLEILNKVDDFVSPSGKFGRWLSKGKVRIWTILESQDNPKVTLGELKPVGVNTPLSLGPAIEADAPRHPSEEYWWGTCGSHWVRSHNRRDICKAEDLEKHIGTGVYLVTQKEPWGAGSGIFPILFGPVTGRE